MNAVAIAEVIRVFSHKSHCSQLELLVFGKADAQSQHPLMPFSKYQFIPQAQILMESSRF